jgi:hypothetical protein
MRKFWLPLLLPFYAASAWAAEAPATDVALGNDAIYQKSLAALTILFVVAVLLESAFAVIFNWRVFLAYFSTRGIKTIIMIVASLIVVSTFDLDVVASLVATYTTPAGQTPVVDSRPVSMFITALILAGGSAGVYNIMYALGYRNDRREQEMEKTPTTGKAWVAVRVVNKAGARDIFVRIKRGNAAGGGSPAPIAGTVGGQRQSLKELLFRNPDRFPQNGGYTVDSGFEYTISVTAVGPDGDLVAMGETFVFADRAIVDFTAELKLKPVA